MSTHLELHHVGEAVLRGLLERLADRKRLGAVLCRLHEKCNLAAVLDHEGVHASIERPLRFETNAPLAPVATVIFDGAHAVDVLCHDGARGLAIEAKLGLDGLSSSAFTKRFLKKVKRSSHQPPRVKGSMTAILDRRSPGGAVLRTSTPSLELVAPWFLVVRAATWRAWERKRPKLSNAHVAVFDEIVAAHGDAGDFDRLVLEQVGSGFHCAWKVSK